MGYRTNWRQYYPVEDPVFGKNQLMDKRGYGVRMILNRSEALSGKRPVYENLGDMELLLTIFAAPPPPEKACRDGSYRHGKVIKASPW